MRKIVAILLVLLTMASPLRSCDDNDQSVQWHAGETGWSTSRDDDASWLEDLLTWPE